MDRRGFLRRAALWGGLSAALVGSSGFVLEGCGEPPSGGDIEYEDCDADDLAEGDPDCGPARRTPKPANTKRTTPSPAKTTKK